MVSRDADDRRMPRSDTTAKSGPASPRVRVRRRPGRASYDLDVVRQILDESLMCHVGFVVDGQPYVLPTLHVRVGDSLLIHGSRRNRMFNLIAKGAPVCVEATVLDGLAMGRSVLQNSVNYRSVVVLGNGTAVEDPEAKLERMLALVEKFIPDRLPDLRPLTDAELASTLLVSIPLDEYSVKIRTGDGSDTAADRALPVWAGELPLRVVPGEPVPDRHVPTGTAVPEYLRSWGRDRTGV
jgi:uncharacterized protein